MKIKLPENWNDIKLGQFITLSQFNTTNPTQQVRDFIKLFNPDINIDDILLDELGSITNDIAWLGTLPSTEIKREFIIGKDKYVYSSSPDLITLGEMVSYEMLTEKITTYEANTILLAILLRKVDNDGKEEEFDSNLIMERKKLFEDNLSIADVFGLCFFLQTGEKPSIITLEGCLELKNELEMELMNLTMKTK